MSAQLASGNSFSAHLALAAGVQVSISAPTLTTLGEVVAKLQPTEAANDTGKSSAQGHAPAASSATTAAPAAARKPTAAASTPAAAPAADPSQASTAAGDAGNGTPPAGQPAAAPTASSEKPAAAAVLPEDQKAAFEVLKKAFLALSTKADGRTKCEEVLKPFGIDKLSKATPEQYPAVLAAIEKASA